MSKKVRKPKDLSKSTFVYEMFGHIYLFDTALNIKEAKGLHAWLTKAIKYLEGKK